MEVQNSDRLAELEKIKFVVPDHPWEERKPELYKKLKEFVKVYEQNVTDISILNTLKEMEAKLK